MTEIPGCCNNCGHPDERLRGRGLSVLIVEFDIDLLAALFLGELDDLRCDACGRPTGVSPTVEFLSMDPMGSSLVVGSLALPYYDSIVEDCRTSCLKLSPDLQPVVLPNMDSLRDVVRNQLRSSIDFLINVVTNPNDEARMSALAHCDARHFAAVLIALGCSQARIRIAGREDGKQLAPDSMVDQCARWQADTWIALLSRAITSGVDAINLEDALDIRFRESILIPGADETALALLETFQQGEPSTSFAVEYCSQAIRACICELAKRNNSQSARWAYLFFKAELTIRLGNERSRAFVERLIVSDERARATISYQDAGEAVAKILADSPPPEVFGALDEIAVKAGHPGLTAELAGTICVKTTKSLTANEILEILRTGLEELGAEPGLIGTMLNQVAHGLVDAGETDEVERLAEMTIALVPDSSAVRAHVYTWLGKSLKELRTPRRFLDHIGESEQAWERSLEDKSKAMLWTERSNALRMIGRPLDALAVIEGALELMRDRKGEADYCVARLNRAILFRETGAPDVSVTELEELLSLPSVRGRLRIDALDSLAIAYYLMGRTAEMVACYENSIPLAVGPFSNLVSASRIKLAAALVADDRYGEASDLLTELDPQIGDDPQVLFAAASAWLTIFHNTKRGTATTAISIRMVSRLSQLARSAERKGSIQDWLGALRLLGAFAELNGNAKSALNIWEAVADICSGHDQPLSYVEILPLARRAYVEDDRDLAREWLLNLPRAVAVDAGRVSNVAAVAQSLAPRVRRGLDELVRLLIDNQSSFADVRLIAEMRRDLVGRSQRYLNQALSDRELAVLEYGLSDEVISALAPERGCLGVLEWIECPEWIACLFTVIDSDGDVCSHVLEYPETELATLAEKMDTRLRAWYMERPGDPFELGAWRELEAWLHRVLAPHLHDDDHLVIFEHGRFAGLPWHVAAAPHWSCSYAAGWTSLLTLPARGDHEPVTSLGLAFVPRFREGAEVLSSLKRSLANGKAVAKRSGLTLLTCEEGACDVAALAHLLANSNVCVLLCHGFVNPAAQEVALMLAHDGALPPASSVAADSKVGRKHRFGWRDARHLEKASPIIFSAACSTGLSHVVGFGERVGLLNGLRDAGTQALVAPRWDAVAESILPILDDALKRYCGGLTLAVSVRGACQNANEHVPRWLAWNLCIEGDWR